MSRKLHKFQTVAEYQAYSASTDYTTPCVAVVAVSAYKAATRWLEFADKFKPLSEKPSE